MAGKNDNFDALMAMMALKHIMDDTKDIEIHPFTCEVTVTPTSISCSSSGNKAFLEDIDGGMEWAEETNNLIKDIMSEQTIKLTDLMKKKFGFDTVKVKPNSEDGFADFLNEDAEVNDKPIILQFAGNVKAGTVAEYGDTGVGQKAAIKKGVASLQEVEVPSPCRLMPYRTFTEVKQPMSSFIFRVKDNDRLGVSCALFEADGGAWKNEAKKNIKEYLEKELDGVPDIFVIS